jgi:hypothetical protein
MSPKTIRNHRAIISAALHQAVRWGWMRENVAERARPPHIAQTRVTAPSVEAVRAIIEAADDFAYDSVKRGDIPSMRIGRGILPPRRR